MPNADTGGRILFKMIEDFVSNNPSSKSFTSLGQTRYLSCLNHVDGVIGNSSSGLAEAPTFKIGTIKCPKNISKPKLVFDVNNYKDYIFIKQIYEYFLPQKKNFTALDVINWYENKYFKMGLN